MHRRFVILHHSQAKGEHWDLMIDLGEALRTWQLFTDPLEANVTAIAAREIGMHRRAYLEYEGPISGDRGSVRRVDEGACEMCEADPGRIHVTFAGGFITGPYFLVRETGEVWRFTPSSPREAPSPNAS